MTERERETTTYTPADLFRRLETIEQGQRAILEQLAALAAAIAAGRDDARFYDAQFVEAFGRLSGKLNAVLEQIVRPPERQSPQSVDDLVRAALAAWERDRGRTTTGS